MKLLNPRILILTQPLYQNYGAILQNYALQVVLKKWNVFPCTIDWIPSRSPLYVYILSWIKTVLLRLVGKKRPFARIEKKKCRKKIFDDWIRNNIVKTTPVTRVSACDMKNISAIIDGSDQVWRPRYVYNIKEYFFDFAKELHFKRIAYAASFGVDWWEYTPKQTKVCSKLAKMFDAISVREQSGVELCKEKLGVDATWVLDPTLLLKKEDYLPICNDIPFCAEKYLAVYVLDENELVKSTYEDLAAARGLIIKKFHADSKSTLTVPEWLAMFRDASYVITDSFHGTVFSIIFGKDFKCLYNKSRGSARFDSLLKLYESGKLDEMRTFSLNWLKKSLEK